MPARPIGLMGLIVSLFVIPRLSLGQQADPPPVKGFLEIAHDPKAFAGQKKTISAVIRSVDAKNADDAYKKVMADDALVLSGGGPESISDITPLAGFKNLKTLVLYNNHISDITPLANLTNLQTLRLEINRVSDISPLKSLTNLESLQIDDNQISDLGPLAGLAHLRTLWIMRNKVKDIAPLAGLAALQDLYLSGNPVTDLAPLTHTSVSDIRLSNLGIEDVSALRDINQNITASINLDLSKNKIRDVASLAHLDRVTTVDLSDNRITDISPFADSKFNFLDLHSNQITDISSFAHSKFSHLDLRNNRITDVSALSTLSTTYVDVRNNPIKDYRPLIALLGAHPGVGILADPGFEKALSDSVPARPELAKSPLLGRWRTDPIETGEFGTLVVWMRFEANGLCHSSLNAPGATDGISPPRHGRYSTAAEVLTLQWGDAEAEKQEMKINGRQLTLGKQDQAMKFKKVD